jgi:hypothetical protein
MATRANEQQDAAHCDIQRHYGKRVCIESNDTRPLTQSQTLIQQYPHRLLHLTRSNGTYELWPLIKCE